MHYWIREVAGWLLVLAGLFVFYVCCAKLLDTTNRNWLLEAGPLTLIGIVVFRGGIHLLKVAVAARVAMQAHADANKPARK